MSTNGPNYATMCFVIMPFGKKTVAKEKVPGSPSPPDQEVDFDEIYREIFRPAIEATPLPEGGHLVPYRTDMNPASMNIDVQMFRGINFARMAIADISGLNANVFYELGVRHQSNESGTAIFRQADAPIPFDINHIKAVPYAYYPPENIGRSRETVQRVLAESLKQNLIDSPIQRAIQGQREMPEAAQEAMKSAEEAIRRQETDAAIADYQRALKVAPDNALLHFKLGLLHKYKGRWREASEQFEAAIAISPDYAEADRELGIAQNKLLKPGSPTGEQALRRAIELNPNDFDAHASLGGVLKRAGRLDEALQEYETAAKLSECHPYPLLNALKIRATNDGRISLDDATKFQLERAVRFRRAQANNSPPMDSPWCFFDLAEIRLYQGSAGDFLKLIDEGLFASGTRRWQAETFRKSLELLSAAGYGPPGMAEGIEKIKRAEPLLPQDET